MGFDDLELSARLDPPLSTVAVPAEEMGRLSAEAILGALSDRRPIQPLILDAPLVLRASTEPVVKAARRTA
jgi:LacI family transcriptional regulator